MDISNIILKIIRMHRIRPPEMYKISVRLLMPSPSYRLLLSYISSYKNLSICKECVRYIFNWSVLYRNIIKIILNGIKSLLYINK